MDDVKRHLHGSEVRADVEEVLQHCVSRRCENRHVALALVVDDHLVNFEVAAPDVVVPDASYGETRRSPRDQRRDFLEKRLGVGLGRRAEENRTREQIRRHHAASESSAAAEARARDEHRHVAIPFLQASGEENYLLADLFAPVVCQAGRVGASRPCVTLAFAPPRVVHSVDREIPGGESARHVPELMRRVAQSGQKQHHRVRFYAFCRRVELHDLALTVRSGEE
mmetsp:Transcript_16880/g.40701  ORF Transcript_16880/g.40701 Transcript_16880/m.40701 type:complete len:225 (-) Transcript_16880:282-956(-)